MKTKIFCKRCHPIAHGVSIVRSQKEGVCHPEERKESLGLTSKLSGEEVNFSLNLQIEYHGGHYI